MSGSGPAGAVVGGLQFYDDEEYQENQQIQSMLEDFIKGYEILKLRIGKLKQSSLDIDHVVSETVSY